MIDLRVADARKHSFPHQARLVYADPPRLHSTNNNYLGNEIEYEQFTLDWLSNTLMYLADPGRIVICTAPEFTYLFHKVFRYHFSTLSFESEIIWFYRFGNHTKKRFVPCHDNLLTFVLGKPPFNWKAVAIESQRQSVGDKRHNPLGTTPPDVWDISRVPGNSSDRIHIKTSNRSCQPKELVRRCVLAYTDITDIVIDPFVGTGTAAYVCSEEFRDYYGIDINPEYINEAKDRVNNHWKVEFKKQ